MAEVYDKLIQLPTTLYLKRLTKKQQKTLKEFDDFNERKNWKRNTRVCQVKTIGHLGDDVKKEYQDMTKEDVNNWLNNKNIKPYSRVTYQFYLQKFLKWLGKDVEGWFEKIENAYDKTIAPSDLWTPQEINELTIRYPEIQSKALVKTVYDSEARINEILAMNIQDVEVISDNVVIFIRESKTKRRRIELLFASREFLLWYNLRKEQAKPSDPLWISKCNRNRNNRLTQSGVWEILQYGKKLLGTEKHINPHLLRHSMASYLRKNGYADGLHSRRMGLSPGSRVLERYSHFSDSEVSNGARIAFGVEPIEKKVEFNPLLPRKCPRCGTDNRRTDIYCSKCFYSIDYENTEKEVTLVEMFRSNYAKFEGVDLDNMVKDFRRFKVETQGMQKILNCFNGGDVVLTNVLRKQLALEEDDALALIQYLMTCELIDVIDDKVTLDDREKFESFIKMQKHYLERKT